MLARLQQALTFGLLTLAAAWAIVWLQAGEPLSAWLGALVIALCYTLFLALEFVMLRLAGHDDPAPSPDVAQLLSAFCHEVLTAPQIFCWRQPFRSRAVPDWLPLDTPPTCCGVLLVHGFLCNRGLWNPWMHRLRRIGIPYLALDLEPAFGSIDDYVQIIDGGVQRLRAATGRPPLIVAHSMGGLAVRAWLARVGASQRVERVITVATPHAGTWLARFSFSLNGRQMRRGSEWLNRLRQREGPLRSERFTCFYSHCDNVVFPVSTATLAGADNRHVPGSAHVDLLFQPEVFNEVLRCAGAPSAG